MKTVKIVLVRSNPDSVVVWGEVKAPDQPGAPTVAHCEAARGRADAFHAAPGRYSYHFRVWPPGTLTLSTEIDGVAAGPPVDFDATEITAGRRYHCEVPS